MRHRGRVAIALQEAPLAKTTVRRNLELALRWWGGDDGGATTGDAVAAALDAFGIGGLADRRARQLSGGQRRRVHLARALVVGAPALLLDEPFTGLDPEVRGDLLADLSGLVREPSRASVIVVHDRAEAWALADRVVVLLDGRVAAEGTPAEVFRRPPTPEVARFVGFTGVIASPGGERLLVRPADVAIDPNADLEATVVRRIPTEDGTMLDCRSEGGDEFQLRADDDAPQPGARVLVRVLGGVTFPPTSAQ